MGETYFVIKIYQLSVIKTHKDFLYKGQVAIIWDKGSSVNTEGREGQADSMQTWATHD